MIIVIIVLGITCVILTTYLLCMKKQMRRIKEQLHKRRVSQASNALLVEMSDKDVREMTAEMNQTLAGEEKLRTEARAREAEFKNLIADISHDLRTPLTVTKGFLQLMEQCGLEGKEKEYLAVCMEHTEELERLLSEFFAYSYWINEENEAVLEQVNVSNLVENVIADFVPLFEKQGLTMRLQSEGSCRVLGEEELLRRVMGNILRNCLAYAAGEVEVTVSRQQTARVSVSVRNRLKDGETPDMERVFERFYTGSQARNKSSGLGLSIVKLLVEKMDGEAFAGLTEGMFEVGFVLKDGERGSDS